MCCDFRDFDGRDRDCRHHQHNHRRNHFYRYVEIEQRDDLDCQRDACRNGPRDRDCGCDFCGNDRNNSFDRCF